MTREPKRGIQMDEEQGLIRLHEAKTGRELAEASFELFKQAVPSLVLFLTLRPMEFELPSFSSAPAFQKYFDEYISGGHKYDIWLRRGPINPTVRVIRHSDHTPLHIFKRSLFYKRIIHVSGCDYGASVVAWRDQAWLSSLTLLRTPEQGDFTDSDVATLLRLQRHFESAVKRVAEFHEAKQGNNSLEVFIWGLPTAAVVLSWDLAVLHHNAAARDLALLWRYGEKARTINAPKIFQLPGDILERLRQEKAHIPEVAPTRHNRPRIFPVITIKHPKIPGMSANVSFLPSKSLAVTRGTFLVALHHEKDTPDETSSYESLQKLTRREREIVQLATEGKSSREIGQQLGTSGSTVRIQLHNIYKKLNIHSRYQLLSLLQTQVAPSKKPLL